MDARNTDLSVISQTFEVPEIYWGAQTKNKNPHLIIINLRQIHKHTQTFLQPFKKTAGIPGPNQKCSDLVKIWYLSSSARIFFPI